MSNLNRDQIIKDGVRWPVGKIGKGEWCECCARYNARNVTCNAVVVRDDKLLLVLRDTEPQKGSWCLPGGYLDWDETTEEAVVRELEEEAGLKGEVVKLLGVRSDLSAGDGRQNVDLFYLVEAEGEVSGGDDEVAKVEWFSWDELPEKLAFEHVAWARKFVGMNNE
jgi:8-oxo-dGTP diphosphatase